MGRTKGSLNKSHKATRLPWAPAYMVALEGRYNALRAERLLVEGAMRHEPSNNRRAALDHAPSSVNASDVRVTARPRVRRNEGWIAANGAWFAREPAPWVETSRDAMTLDRRSMGTYETYRVPTWYLAMIGALDRETQSKALAPFTRHTVTVERDRGSRTPHKATTAHDGAGDYFARLALLGATGDVSD